MNKFLSQIPKNRLIAYALIIGLMPILGAGFHFYTKTQEINLLQENLDGIKQTALMIEAKQALNKTVMAHYEGADRFYIDKNIESIPLLAKETEALKKISKQNNFIENEAVTNRLNYLQNRNSLVFAEGVVQSYPHFSETTETLVRPVEVDLVDLQNILAKIEGAQIGPYEPGPTPPQMIITDFKLEKKETTKENEVFNLNVKLIKREYASGKSNI